MISIHFPDLTDLMVNDHSWWCFVTSWISLYTMCQLDTEDNQFDMSFARPARSHTHLTFSCCNAGRFCWLVDCQKILQ